MDGPRYIDGYPVERVPDVVLKHLAPIPAPGSATGGTDVALRALLLNIFSYLEPAVLSPDLIQGFVDTQVTT
jgi:hypothetical protein